MQLTKLSHIGMFLQYQGYKTRAAIYDVIDNVM